jgi:hypothetical protein
MILSVCLSEFYLSEITLQNVDEINIYGRGMYIDHCLAYLILVHVDPI